MKESRIEGEQLKTLLKSFPRRMESLPKSRLVVIGDIGLDEYVLGDVRRISPEAPVPVLEVQSTDARLGLAANVAQNVASLGGEALLVAVVGEDATADNLRAKLRSAEVSPDHLIVDKSRPTTRKLRVMSGPHHIVRVDFEKKQYLSEAVEAAVVAKVKGLLSSAAGVIIEDYAKGVLSEKAIQAIIRESHAAGKKVFVDPNRGTPAKFYSGADVITPNRDEAVELSGLDYDDLQVSPNFILEVGQALRAGMKVENIVITRGKDGMTLIDSGEAVHMPTFARQVFDVTGAGDTVIAALALAHVGGFTLPEACVFGNVAAGVVVGKVGCVPCTRGELLDYIGVLTEA
ncbi:MAG: D-glycero-beta-D-manno-heptose-7-phosphate kinase [Bdellovibrionales bacterium]|nr:D-glycero-beta-D-manno-heptose-7-phosphate kinase [Bdellovibrionales bacterium]